MPARDVTAKLSQQVEEVQNLVELRGDTGPVTFRCFLTGSRVHPA